MPELPLVQALAELPGTPDGIADRMRAMEIKGKRFNTGCCPVAQWLKTKGFTHISVGQTACVGRRDSGATHDASTPPAVAEFVRRIDDPYGPYLDLVEVP